MDDETHDEEATPPEPDFLPSALDAMQRHIDDSQRIYTDSRVGGTINGTYAYATPQMISPRRIRELVEAPIGPGTFLVTTDEESDEDSEDSSDDRVVEWRGYDEGLQFVSTTPGSVLTHTRAFGIEIETIAPSRAAAARASHELPKAVGVGEDGSLRRGDRSNGFGVEFALPRASGDKGEALVQTVCNTLVKHKFSVNESCGLHVHFDMQDLLPQKADAEMTIGQKRIKAAKWVMSMHTDTTNGWLVEREGNSLALKYEEAWIRGGFIDSELVRIQHDETFDYYVEQQENGSENVHRFVTLQRILALYTTFDDVILSFLPISRRSNKYCYPFRSYFSIEELRRAKDHAEIEAMWYRLSKTEIIRAKGVHKHGSRYNGINLHTFFSAGHMEVRYHSGTLNALKMLYWVELHNAILENADSWSLDKYKDIQSEIRLEKKAEALFSLIKLSDDARNYFRARQKKFLKQTKEVAILANKRKPETCVV